jgi:hypothetical protein
MGDAITSNRRYLYVYEHATPEFPRQDLYLIARLAHPDTATDALIRDSYLSLVKEEPNSFDLNNPQKRVKRRHLTRDLLRRTLAGAVVLEAIQLARNGVSQVTVNKAMKLAAFNQCEFKNKNPAQIETQFDEVKKAFRKYRNTAHLQAALQIQGGEFKRGRVDCMFSERVLEYAKYCEEFVDERLLSFGLKWNPYRVPASVPSRSDFPVPELSKEERAYLRII